MDKKHVPVQSLFKRISGNIKIVVGMLRSCKSICAPSMLSIRKIKQKKKVDQHKYR